LEKDAEIGGYCKTIKWGDFVWDYSGHFFHFRDTFLEDYICRNMVHDDIRYCEKHTQIFYRQKYIDFPFQKNIHQLDQDEFIDCLYDLFTTTGNDYFTFKQMLYAKFGQSIAEKFLIPYNEKLYACDLNRLDVDAMGRFFPYADKEEIIRNFKKTNNNSYNSHFTYPRGGAIEYVKSLASYIGKSNICLNECVKSIDVTEKTIKTDKRELKYDNLISTMPFPLLMQCCSMEYDTDIYSWNKVLVFNLGFDKKGKDVFNNWIYVPSKDFCFYRVGYYDNIFATKNMSLYVELGFGKNTDVIDVEYYKEKVLDDLKKAGIITDHKLIASHFVIMDPAYVHITKESIRDVEEKKKVLARNNIYSIGRYGSWTYCSIEDNILEAKALMERLSDY
jgi:protoporphyrinogen oxidase